MQYARQTAYRAVTAAGILLLAAVVAYRFTNPVSYSTASITVIIGLTTAIILLAEHQDSTDHRGARLHLGHAVFAVFVTLLVLLVSLYLAGMALIGVQQLAPQSRLLAATLFELFQLIHLLGALSPLWFAVFYATTAAFIAAGTWIIAPHLPFTVPHREAAAFTLAGIYGLAVFALLEPTLYQPTMYQAAIDLVFLLAGGRVFVIVNRTVYQYWKHNHTL